MLPSHDNIHSVMAHQRPAGRYRSVTSERMSGACGNKPISTKERASTYSARGSNLPVRLNMPINSS